MRLGLRRLPVLKALWTKNARPTWRDSEERVIVLYSNISFSWRSYVALGDIGVCAIARRSL